MNFLDGFIENIKGQLVPALHNSQPKTINEMRIVIRNIPCLIESSNVQDWSLEEVETNKFMLKINHINSVKLVEIPFNYNLTVTSA